MAEAKLRKSIKLSRGLTLYLQDPRCPLLEFKSSTHSACINIITMAQNSGVGDGVIAWLNEQLKMNQEAEGKTI